MNSEKKKLEEAVSSMEAHTPEYAAFVAGVMAAYRRIVKQVEENLIEAAPVNGRVKHLARYARKKRIRKKNFKKCVQAFCKA